MFKYYYLLPSILYNAAISCPNKVAIIIQHHQYTYDDILKMSMTFAKKLIKNKYQKLSRIIILSGNSLTTIIAFWGAIFAEMIPCIIDSELEDQSLEHIEKSLEPVYVVRDNEIIMSDNLIDHKNICFSSTESNLAIILHTSGSTGFPKGVMLSHRNVLSAVEAIICYLDIVSDDVILSVLPMHFDYGLYQMLLAFYAKATLILEKNALLPPVILHNINRYHVTVLPCIPFIVQLLVVANKMRKMAVNFIRLVTNTGEYLSQNHIQKLQHLFPKAAIFSMFGLTECKRCSYVPPHELSRKSESIGIPMFNLSMWIEDEQGNMQGPDCEGWLVISGPTVMMGYWKNPEETNKKIRVMPDGQKILITGDRAVMDKDGYFYFRGRSDHVIKFHGMKLNCHDTAKKMMQIDGVNRAYLFLNTPENSNELIVCIELEKNVELSDSFKKALYQPFHTLQHPRYFYFSYDFPMLSNGKLNKHELERQAIRQYHEY